MSAEPDEKREIRIANYAAKVAAGFRCEGGDEDRCTATDRLLVVTMRGADKGSLGVYCERHIDGRKHEIRPAQWHEAEAIRARMG